VPNVLSLLLLLLVVFKPLLHDNLNESLRGSSIAPRTCFRCAACALGGGMAQANSTEGRVEAELPGVA